MTRARLSIVNHTAQRVEIDHARLQAVLDAALAEDGIAAAELALLLVDDAESARLHAQHFDDAEPTDVMTFPDGSINPETSLTRLGDLAICVDVAHREGLARGRSTGDEIILYALHGVLHLQGYDDEAEADLAEMWATQRRLLATVGIAIEAEPS